MRNLKIFTKIFLSHTTLALSVVVVLSAIFYTLLSDALIQRTIDQLSSINILKQELVSNYLSRSQKNLEALRLENKFLNLFLALSHVADGAQTPDDLKTISDLLDLYDFDNIRLLDVQHRQLFSTTGEALPPEIVARIDSIIEQSADRFHIIDASHHSTDKRPMLIYCLPVIRDGHMIGTALVQENFQRIEEILLERTGMGSSGESYIVADDYYMRSSSRFLHDPPLTIKVETDAVNHIFNNETGFAPHIIDDYRGVKVLSVYQRVKSQDLNWVVLSEMDLSEAMQPIIRLRNYLIGIIFVLIIFTMLITFFLSNAIARPVHQLKNIIVSLSKGIIPENKPPVTSDDEIGQMARAIHQLMEGLKRTTTFANEIGSGNFDTSFTTLSDKDTLGLALIQMRDELRKLSERELKLERERAAALLEGQENERMRIIQDLHDGVGQMLTAIRIRVDMLEQETQLKDEIKTQINETIAEVRRISYNVMPQALVDYGLEAALNGLCKNIKQYSSLSIDFRYVREVEHKLNFDISIAVFRIVQEGLNNIVKHAQATHADLHILDKEEELYFILADNGIGFKEDEMSQLSGSGLRNMKERARLLNGTVEIHTAPGNGTVVEVSIPILPNYIAL